MSVVLITGAATGIGRLTALALAKDGHTVYATMRDPQGRNAQRAADLVADAAAGDVRVLELDVASQDSADAAVAEIVTRSGRLDVVVHNAAHLVIGYAEAFEPDQLAQLFDVNVIGSQRVNRAALPQLRRQQSGTLVYIGSTSTIVIPPFMAAYVASKAAFDALAQATAYEVAPFGIDTVIVMPGPFTQGTEHFPNAGRAADAEVTAQYARLDDLVARNESATEALFEPGSDAHPRAVGEEVARLLALPAAERPARSVIDFTDSGVDEVNRLALDAQHRFLDRLGFAGLAHPS